jgi:hypothetical protein
MALRNGADNRPDQAPLLDRAFAIRIAGDGAWFHEGTPIQRMPLVKLFASVLKRDEAGDYWLITPAERGRIQVDDAPFVAVEVTRTGAGEDQKLTFRTNLDECVDAGPDHPIRIEPSGLSQEPQPYIVVRDRLDALISRSVFYELVQLAEERPTPEGIEFGVWSARTFFPLGTIDPDDLSR